MLFFQVRHNNRPFFSLSLNLQPWFKIPVWLCCFLPRVYKINHWCIIFVLVASAVATVGPGMLYPPNDCLCPPISVYSECFFGGSRITKRQQAIKEKGLIIFKHNSRLKFIPFFSKLLATNCFTQM